MRSIEWADGDIAVIDQTALPHRFETKRLHDTPELCDAIARLAIRGAPALGIAGAMGVAQAAARAPRGEALERAQEAAVRIVATRPTAVNLAWGTQRVLERARRAARSVSESELVELMLEEALFVQAEDETACIAMAKHSLEFFARGATVMTHCNTGFLCTGGSGTALGAIRNAHDEGLGISVIATETRPLLQGARLTAWELGRFGIPHHLVVDAAAPGLIARGEVSLVITGADRIAANGDVANKVGTYPLALAAREAGVPFVVVAPTSTVDLATASGSDIEVEERSSDEVTQLMPHFRTAPEGTPARNPAFDVTPAKLVTAIVTEHGVARAPFKASLKKIFA